MPIIYITMTLSKQEIRKSLLLKRRDLSSISDAIVADIVSSGVLDNVKTVGLYYPLDKEIDVRSLIKIYPNKTFCFPKTSDVISFYKENDLNNFEKRKFNVYEPLSNNLILRDDIELFIIPCVGITKTKQRIGYGKGYYDRYLEGYNGLKIGVIYKELNNIDLIADPYDVKLDIVFEE